MSAVDDIRGVIRIAKAASLGVTGNQPRIERAEKALTELIEAAQQLREDFAFFADQHTCCAPPDFERIDVALGKPPKQPTFQV